MKFLYLYQINNGTVSEPWKSFTTAPSINFKKVLK